MQPIKARCFKKIRVSCNLKGCRHEHTAESQSINRTRYVDTLCENAVPWCAIAPINPLFTSVTHDVGTTTVKVNGKIRQCISARKLHAPKVAG